MDKKTIGLAGCGLLVIGVFLPIVKLPFGGSINYFYNGHGDGVLVLVLAAISLIAILVNKYKMLFLTSIASLALMIFTLVNFTSNLELSREEIKNSLDGNPFAGIADSMMQSAQIEWGWIVLIIGSLLLLFSAILNNKKNA